jgi:hypothetical protein
LDTQAVVVVQVAEVAEAVVEAEAVTAVMLLEA